MSIRMTWGKKEWRLWWGWSLWWWKRHDKEREKCSLVSSEEVRIARKSLLRGVICVSHVSLSLRFCPVLCFPSHDCLRQTITRLVASLTSWLLFSTSCLILLSSHTFLECDTSFVVVRLVLSSAHQKVLYYLFRKLWSSSSRIIFYVRRTKEVS